MRLIERDTLAAEMPPAFDLCTGLFVRAVIPAPWGSFWAEFREDAEEGADPWATPVIAWAECLTKEGQWAGLFPVVLNPARLNAEIADPEEGYRGLSRGTRGASKAWPE